MGRRGVLAGQARLLPAPIDGVPYPQPLTGHEPQYVPWGVLLVRPIGHPPRPVPPRAADQRSRAYPTLLRVLRWGRCGHRGEGQTPEAGPLASVPYGPLSSRPPPSRSVGPCPSTLYPCVSPSPRSFLLSRAPAVSCLSPALSLRSSPHWHFACQCLGRVQVGVARACLLPAPLAARHSLRPCVRSVPPPHFSCLTFPSPCRPRPLLEGVGVGALVLSFPLWHARCGHDASTWRGTCPRGGGLLPFCSLRPSWPPRSLRFPSYSLCGGGGLLFDPLRCPSCPVSPPLEASMMHAQCKHIPSPHSNQRGWHAKKSLCTDFAILPWNCKLVSSTNRAPKELTAPVTGRIK